MKNKKEKTMHCVDYVFGSVSTPNIIFCSLQNLSIYFVCSTGANIGGILLCICGA